MTLWDRKLGLILGLALFTFACEEPGEIGLDINPENGAFIARYFEIPLENSITQHEDILSDNATRIDELSQNPKGDGRLLVGNYNSSEFGALSTKAFSSFSLGQSGFKPEDYLFDSLILYLRVDYIYGNNFLGNKRIYVHELIEDIESEPLKLTRDSEPYSIEPVGELNFDISGIDTTRVDTVLTARISDELGQLLLDSAQSDTLNFYNNVNLREFFKGFSFVPEDMNNVVAGIHAESDSTFMRMYIHSAKDTSYFDFIIPGYTVDTIYTETDTLYNSVNITRYYNNITLDKSGSSLAGIPGYYEDFETDDDLSYIQGSTGVFTKLNFGDYYNFLDTAKNHVINRAELVIPVNTYTDFLDPSLSLALYVTDESNHFVESEADSTKIVYETVGAVSYKELKNENRGEYVGEITTYIQDLSSGERTDSLILIGQGGLYNSVISINQTVIEKDQIYLKVYYSSIK